jgi:3-isopropylmalate/(R)-2-methylmalate dehydratase small subunit
MEGFLEHTGIAVPLRRADIDTDQIISAKFLRRITRDGYEDALFASWRADPSFVLNRDPYAGGSILVAGHDFGIGSSREQAVWALQNYGFRVVIASRFGDIFRTNAGKSGLLAAVVSDADTEVLWDAIEAAPGARLRVDLELLSIAVIGHEQIAPIAFEVPEHTRQRLLSGLGEIEATLQHVAEIERYEVGRSPLKPTVAAAHQGAGGSA